MKLQRNSMMTAVFTSALLLGFGVASASATSANISRSYDAASPISVGSIVSLAAQKSNTVESANIDNGSRLLGVAVANNDSLIAVGSTNSTIQVATNGIASTLVSTLNGNINPGDQIAVSPFNGIGMKSTTGSHVIGLAQTGFNSGSQGALEQKVTTTAHKTSQVWVGYVRLNIAVGVDATGQGGSKLNPLQQIVKSITGRTIPTARVILGLVVSLIAVIAIVTLIYASIYGSIVSIGRNPLARPAIFRALNSVLGMTLLVAIVATMTVVLLLD